MGDKRARKREIRQSPKDTSGRAWRPGSKVHVLTRGDLAGENRQEVSRSHSSEDACRKAGTAKGRRVTKEPQSHSYLKGEQVAETPRRGNYGSYHGGKARKAGGSCKTRIAATELIK